MADNYFGITDTGKMRTNNEDAFIAESVADNSIILAGVIDGVGGYEGGEVAAKLSREAILDTVRKSALTNKISILQNAIVAANEAIYNRKKVDKENDQMACVLTIALVDTANNKLHFAHVGDTRLYLLRDSSLIKLTKDHSFVGFLEDSGRLTEEAAMRHPKRNEINKALGFEPQLQVRDYVETGESPFLPGDKILLCSDGLSDMVDKSTMTSILQINTSLSTIGKSLIDAANNAGGKDNITAVIVHNTKPAIQHAATKPAPVSTIEEEKTTIQKNDAPVSIARPIESNHGKKKTSSISILGVLFVLLLAAFLWLVYQNYIKSKNPVNANSQSLVTKEKSEAEVLLSDSIQQTKTGEVFVLNQEGNAPIILSDSISINKDSIHIIGNGVFLTGDESFTGPAFSIGTSCKYVLLDSITFQNFDVALLCNTSNVHFKNIRFVNCRVPVQYQVFLNQQQTISGKFADSIFTLSDSSYNNF